ncbi:MAG TPA: molybdopterin-dependent oxidoreductase [Candidatus Saccharimonadales bacterium]|nr:molybdopterin-dependent oxidoreductase [Candidatus Saccharimonadales bacterium]
MPSDRSASAGRASASLTSETSGAPIGPATPIASGAATLKSRAASRAAMIPDVIAGVLAAAVALAASELLAGLVPGVPSLAIAVGALVISLQPPGAKDFMATLFGTHDKLALNLVVVIVALVLGGVVGIVARRRPSTAISIFIAFGALGLVASVYSIFAPPALSLLNALVAVALGLWTLRVLLGLSPAGQAVNGAGSRQTASPMPDWARRRFLIRSAGFVGVAIAAGGVGRYMLDREHPTGAPATAGLLPAPATAVPALAADQSLTAPSLTPIVVANDAFYRIDTALLVPQVDASAWQLRVTGMVDHPLTFTYNDLLAMPLFEQYVTIQCVSDIVGGDLVGNALWTGVRLREVLANAGVQAGATQIIGRAVDGFTVGFPTAWAMAPQREPMVVVGMNRKPLPAEHGYPARLIVPGLYGYVSATKWLTEIQLTTDALNAYWVNLGWAKDGPILTQSRIDHPANADVVPAGNVEIDGLAWAPDRGISRVEVRIDNGSWQPAMLSRAISPATWVQWLYNWNATTGDHTIEVRATDGTGAVQTDAVTDPFPDGARGHQRILVQVK